jgi:hypothetical protein
MMPNNNLTLFQTLKDGIAALAKNTLADFFEEAVADGNAILLAWKTKITNWSELLARGEIDADDLRSLVLGERDLLQLEALRQKGLALIRVDQFKRDLCNLVVTVVTGLI